MPCFQGLSTAKREPSGSCRKPPSKGQMQLQRRRISGIPIDGFNHQKNLDCASPGRLNGPDRYIQDQRWSIPRLGQLKQPLSLGRIRSETIPPHADPNSLKAPGLKQIPGVYKPLITGFSENYL